MEKLNIITSEQTEVQTNPDEVNLKEFFDPKNSLAKRVEQFNHAKDMYGDKYKLLYRREVNSLMSNRINITDTVSNTDRQMLMFGSNNYQGFADNPRVQQATKQAVGKYGVGSGGSSLLCGTSTMHTTLEKNLASFKGKDETVLFSSGYSAQQGWINALVDNDDIIFFDSYSHASFNEGVRSTGLKKVPFRHNDLIDLERKLKAFRRRRDSAWIFVEGVYSMHGDTVDLKTVVELAKRYDCKIAVDDAHGVGVLGENGQGIEAHCGVDPKDITVSMGTFSKAFGTVGGYVCTSSTYADFIRYMASSSMFSTAFPAAIAAAANEGINILREEPERMTLLRENVDYLIRGLEGIGIQTTTDSSIVPISVPADSNAKEMAIAYDEANIFISLVAYPAVPLDQQRFRATVMHSHTKADMDRLVEVTRKIFQNH